MMKQKIMLNLFEFLVFNYSLKDKNLMELHSNLKTEERTPSLLN